MVLGALGQVNLVHRIWDKMLLSVTNAHRAVEGASGAILTLLGACMVLAQQIMSGSNVQYKTQPL